MEQFPIVEKYRRNGKYDKNGDCFYHKNTSGYERYFTTIRDETGTYPVFYFPEEK